MVNSNPEEEGNEPISLAHSDTEKSTGSNAGNDWAAPLSADAGVVWHGMVWVGHGAGFALLAMVATQGSVVLIRAIFGLSLPALQDMTIYLHAMAILLGLSVALMRDAHVRIALRRQRSQQTELLGSLFLTLPFAVILMVLAWPYAWRSWLAGEGSVDPDGLGGVYLIKFAIVAAGALLALVAAGKALSAFRSLTVGR